MGKKIPKRCPNCGSANIHNQELEPSNDLEELYDVYCRDCEWSGYISPDLPLTPEEKVSPEETKELKARKREVLHGEYVPLEEVLKKHGVQKAKTLLDIDVRCVLERVEEKYGLKLPKKVITIDYGDDMGDLYVRFHHAESTEGEATKDGKVVVHYDKKGKISAIEITDITTL